MIFRTKPQAIKDYFNSKEYLSQSLGKALADGLDEYNKMLNPVESDKLYFEEPQDYFITGSAVDAMLTQGEDTFFDDYHISEATSKPSDAIISIYMQVLDKVRQDYLADHVDNEVTLSQYWSGMVQQGTKDAYVIEACDAHNYQARWGSEARLNAVKIESDYFTDLIASDGKKVLSQNEYTKVLDIVKSIRGLYGVQHLFDESLIFDRNKHILFQVPVYYTTNGIRKRALLDMVYIDMGRGIITPFDLKTMSGRTFDFISSFHLRRYDIQAAWYRDAIQFGNLGETIENNMYYVNPGVIDPESDHEDNGNSELVKAHYDGLTERLCANVHGGWLGKNFKFIVESTTSTGNPMLFYVNEDSLKIARSGQPTIYGDGVTLKGAIHSFMDRKFRIGIQQIDALYKFYSSYGFEKDYRHHDLLGDNEGTYIDVVKGNDQYDRLF